MWPGTNYPIKMARVAEAHKAKTIGAQAFEVNGQAYAIYRFANDRGPTLAGSIDFSQFKGEMLTIEEARAIKSDARANAAFRANLKPGEWGYLIDHGLEGKPWAALLLHDWNDKRLKTLRYYSDVEASIVVILKIDSMEMAALREGANGPADKNAIRGTEN